MGAGKLIEGSIFTAIEADSSTCPRGHRVVLLTTTTQSRLPSFYICHTCGFIGEAGVGVVTPGRDA